MELLGCSGMAGHARSIRCAVFTLIVWVGMLLPAQADTFNIVSFTPPPGTRT